MRGVYVLVIICMNLIMVMVEIVVIVVTVVMVTAVMVRGGSTIHLKGRLGVRRSKGTSGRGGLEVRDI